MTQELYYTSAPRGLLPGSGGFCTVAATPGLAPALLERLESLSSYRPLFPPHHPRAADNPVACSHLRVTVGGRTFSLLSRIAPAPLDHTGRTNLFAHHVVLDGSELPEGGPAWLLQHDSFPMASDFHDEPRYLEARRPPRGGPHTGAARTWKAVTGDEGWAGVLAERFEREPTHPVYLIFEPGLDPLPLLAEALALLSPGRRWEATFSTYFTSLPPGVTCTWRCVPRGSPEALNALRLPDTLNLCASLGRAPSSALVEAARTGKRPTPSVAAAPRPAARPASSRDTPPPRKREAKPAPAPTDEASEPARAGRLLPFLGGLVLGALVMFGVALALWYLPGTRQHEELRSERDELEEKCAGRDEKIANLEKTLAASGQQVEALQQEKQALCNTFEQSTLPEAIRDELAAVAKEPARGTRQVQERMTGWAVGLMRQAAATEKERLTRDLENALDQQRFQGAPLALDHKLLARDPGKAITLTIADLEKRAQKRPDERDRVLTAIKKALHSNKPMMDEINFALRGERIEQHLLGIGQTFKEWYAQRIHEEAPDYMKWLEAQASYHTFLSLKIEPDDQKRCQACDQALRLCDEILKRGKPDSIAQGKARALSEELDRWQRRNDGDSWRRRHEEPPPPKRD